MVGDVGSVVVVMCCESTVLCDTHSPPLGLGTLTENAGKKDTVLAFQLVAHYECLLDSLETPHWGL